MADEVEEKDIQQNIGEEEAATGRRWGLSLFMIAVGIAGVVAGVFLDKIVLVVGGLALMALFGLVAAGATRVGINIKSFFAGAKLPRNIGVKTSRVKKTGLEPHGRSPAERPSSKERGHSSQKQETAQDRRNSEEL